MHAGIIRRLSMLYAVAFLAAGCRDKDPEYLYLGAVTPSQIIEGNPRWIDNELSLLGNVDIVDRSVWVVDRETGDRIRVSEVPDEVLACLQPLEGTYLSIGAIYRTNGILFNGEILQGSEGIPHAICGTT